MCVKINLSNTNIVQKPISGKIIISIYFLYRLRVMQAGTEFGYFDETCRINVANVNLDMYW